MSRKNKSIAIISIASLLTASIIWLFNQNHPHTISLTVLLKANPQSTNTNTDTINLSINNGSTTPYTSGAPISIDIKDGDFFTASIYGYYSRKIEFVDAKQLRNMSITLYKSFPANKRTIEGIIQDTNDQNSEFKVYLPGTLYNSRTDNSGIYTLGINPNHDENVKTVYKGKFKQIIIKSQTIPTTTNPETKDDHATIDIAFDDSKKFPPSF